MFTHSFRSTHPSTRHKILFSARRTYTARGARQDTGSAEEFWQGTSKFPALFLALLIIQRSPILARCGFSTHNLISKRSLTKIMKLSTESHFANDLGLDSVDTVEVVMAIEEVLPRPRFLRSWVITWDGRNSALRFPTRKRIKSSAVSIVWPFESSQWSKSRV